MNLLIKEVSASGWTVCCGCPDPPLQGPGTVPPTVGRAGCSPHSYTLSRNYPWPKKTTLRKFTLISTNCPTQGYKDPLSLPRFTSEGSPSFRAPCGVSRGPCCSCLEVHFLSLTHPAFLIPSRCVPENTPACKPPACRTLLRVSVLGNRT